MANGATLAAGLSAGFGGARPIAVYQDDGARRNAHHSERLDVHLGRWSYKRKGKRTAAQVQRAARKKRNRARNK